MNLEKKYQKLKIKSFLILLTAILAMVSCQPAEHSFTTEELKLIDSLYQIKKDTVEIQMKAECDSVFLEVFNEVVDSLKEVRRKEIMDIIGE